MTLWWDVPPQGHKIDAYWRRERQRARLGERDEGVERGCGRFVWQVLDWNDLAREFYSRRNAQWLQEWLLYRIAY